MWEAPGSSVLPGGPGCAAFEVREGPRVYGSDLPSGRPRLLDRVRDELRVRHDSRRTERAYRHWIVRFVRFHGCRHPCEMGSGEVTAFLSHLGVRERVAAETALIQDVQTDEWWQDVTVPMLEVMRRRLRGLVQLIDKRQRKPVYTDFEDLMGGEIDVALPGFAQGTDYAKFRAKARLFLREHMNHVAVEKLRKNKPLTVIDIDELERMLVEGGLGGPDEVHRPAEESQGLGVFVRSLVGMDRIAAKDALATFQAGESLSANQIEFVNLIVDHLTEHGVVSPERLYESPFTDRTTAMAA
jgi:type I restriction enzyme R subunit